MTTPRTAILATVVAVMLMPLAGLGSAHHVGDEIVCGVEPVADELCTMPGDSLWASIYTGEGFSINNAYDIAVHPDGDLTFVTGQSIGDGTGYDFGTVAYNVADGSEAWSARYDHDGLGDEPSAIVANPDGSQVFVTGGSGSSRNQGDYATVAYDAQTGAEQWVVRAAGSFDKANAMGISPDGSTLFVTGQSPGDGTHYDYKTIAYNTNDGSEIWTARYNSPESSADIPNDLAVSPDGSMILITGQSWGGSATQYDYATLAYDATSGAELWATHYDGPASQRDMANSVALNHDGSAAFVTGESPGVGTNRDYATIAYDTTTGAELWASRYDGPVSGNDVAEAVATSLDGSTVFVFGESTGDDTRTDFATLAYNAADGSQVWETRYDAEADTEQAADMVLSPDGDQIYVAGRGKSSASPHYEVLTIGYDASTGAEEFVGRYGNPDVNGHDGTSAITVSPDGTRIFTTGLGQDDFTFENRYQTVAFMARPQIDLLHEDPLA